MFFLAKLRDWGDIYLKKAKTEMIFFGWYISGIFDAMISLLFWDIYFISHFFLFFYYFIYSALIVIKFISDKRKMGKKGKKFLFQCTGKKDEKTKIFYNFFSVLLFHFQFNSLYWSYFLLRNFLMEFIKKIPKCIKLNLQI